MVVANLLGREGTVRHWTGDAAREDKVKQQRANIRSRLQAAAFDLKDKNRNVDEAARDIQSLSYTIVECHSRMDRQWTEMEMGD